MKKEGDADPPCLELQPIECEKHRGCFECPYYSKVDPSIRRKQIEKRQGKIFGVFCF